MSENKERTLQPFKVETGATYVEIEVAAQPRGEAE